MKLYNEFKNTLSTIYEHRKALFGGLLILWGIIFGIYVGIYVMLAGGIVDIISWIKIIWETGEIGSSMLLGKGVFKIIFAAVTGWLSALMLILPGKQLIMDD